MHGQQRESRNLNQLAQVGFGQSSVANDQLLRRRYGSQPAERIGKPSWGLSVKVQSHDGAEQNEQA